MLLWQIHKSMHPSDIAATIFSFVCEKYIESWAEIIIRKFEYKINSKAKWKFTFEYMLWNWTTTEC